MTDPASRTRRNLTVAGAVLVPLVAALIWASARMWPRTPDDPSELLRRAGASNSAGEPKLTGKAVKIETVSSAGTRVRGSMPEVRDGSGRVGYGLHLRE